MERSESIVNISKALVKVMNEMEKAKKDSKNPYYKSNYADINSLHEASKPALAAKIICWKQTFLFLNNDLS